MIPKNNQVDYELAYFLDSPLPSETEWQAAKNQVENGIKQFTDDTTGGRIDLTFTVLNKIIEEERTKEIAFINMLRQELIKQIRSDDPDSQKKIEELNAEIDKNKWKEFIQEFQKYIGVRHKKKQYKSKKTDASTDDPITEYWSQVYKGSRLIADATTTKIRSILKRSDLIGTLLSKSKTITTLATNAATDESQKIHLVTQLRAILLRSAYMGVLNPNSSSMSDRKIRHIIDRDLGAELKELEEQLTYTTDNEEKKQIIKQIQAIKNQQSIFNELRSAKTAEECLEKAIEMLQIEFNAISQDVMAEWIGLIEHSLHKGFIGGGKLGHQGAKPDVLVGYINIEASEDSKKAVQNYLDNYIKGMTKTNTVDYYRKRANYIKREAPTDITDDWFIIEESTKSYAKVAAKKGSQFEGGSLGPTLTDQLQKIALFNASLSTHRSLFLLDLNTDETQLLKEEVEELTWLVVNTVTGLIAQDYKNPLLAYIASIAVTFLFDDQFLILDQAITDWINKTTKATNTHRLHLFALQQDYYPLSFVLEAVKKRLAHTIQNFIAQQQSNGVEVKTPNQTIDRLGRSGATILFSPKPGQTSIQIDANKIDANKSENYQKTLFTNLKTQYRLKINFLNDFNKLINEIFP